MGELYFKAELLDDVIVSQSSATVGDHKSLDYIPGSAFLGIAAARLYPTSKDPWKLFHTSKVHFCNAYPMINNSRSLPIPLSLHSEKVPRLGKEKSAFNFTYGDVKEEGIQYKQNRTGYVALDNGKLNLITPSKTSRMRTAVDAKTGTAAKSQLYGYESIDAGQIFVGKIEWDDSVSNLIESVLDIFKPGEIVHVGRSKTASYGRVKVSELKGVSISKNTPSGTSFSIIAVSDLCLKNPVTGAPELNLTPDFLGLGNNWTLDKSKSFTRPSCIYQYNSYRKEIEMQKTLISKGSVFTFKSDNELTAAETANILSVVKNGIGDAKGQGFGEIDVFDTGKEFTRIDSNTVTTDCAKELTSEESKWLEWFKSESLSNDVEEKVMNAVSKFVELCKAIKTFQTFDDEIIFWPGNAQWGRILETSRLCQTKAELHSSLFEGNTPIIKPIMETHTERNGDTVVRNPDPEWNYEASPCGQTLRNWLMTFINDNSLDDRNIKIALQELVKRCKDKIADKNWLDGEEE
ncbi:MAG: hypothetical protein K5930_01325 [Treponemataceae bacterium]|nr:hypothetical protein [Treponemataceae bacterium]